MWKSLPILGLLALASVPPGFSLGSRRADRPPNVVFIFADDLGYGDVGAFNPESKIPTPNIDRLARQGIRLTDVHAAGSVCVPSRYGLLTGRYMFRSRRVFQKQALIEPGRLTLASVLKRAGYATAMIGKWHLSFDGGGLSPGGGPGSGEAFDYTKPLRGGPMDHGFDRFFGMHASLDVAPYFFIEDDRVVNAPSGTIEERHTAGEIYPGRILARRCHCNRFQTPGGAVTICREGSPVSGEPGRVSAALLPVSCADGSPSAVAAA